VDTVHECDGHTDRITITKTVHRIASNGKRGTFQVYIFKSVQILAYFFTLNISTHLFTSKGEGGSCIAPKYAIDQQ